MSSEGEILNAKKWVSESTRGVLYGVCFIFAGAVGAILGHEHDLPTGVQVCAGGIGLLI